MRHWVYLDASVQSMLWMNLRVRTLVHQFVKFGASVFLTGYTPAVMETFGHGYIFWWLRNHQFSRRIHLAVTHHLDPNRD
mmetsp:Transcript_10219/g.19310  ORF Transcript_10219/g.19310 Transcript_10219/m.19310 type:complete len:80 (-) Transcript_10219:551-790(-)